MTNNDILRRLRYALQLNDTQVVKVIAHTEKKVTIGEVASWLKPENDPDLVAVEEVILCRFLDGLIIEKRGLRPDGQIPEPRESLSNNEVLRKLRIALNLREEGMIEVFQETEFVVTKAELSAFFRKEGHRNYRECPEQVLRKFLQGLSKRVG